MTQGLPPTVASLSELDIKVEALAWKVIAGTASPAERDQYIELSRERLRLIRQASSEADPERGRLRQRPVAPPHSGRSRQGQS